jgi:hypothetical protein
MTGSGVDDRGFQNEQEAKAFAIARLPDGMNIGTGKPKRTIASAQIPDWPMNRICNQGTNTVESEMADEPHLPRFLVRRGAKRDWMVWDRQIKGPAKYFGYPAVELPEDRAREIADELTKKYSAEG